MFRIARKRADQIQINDIVLEGVRKYRVCEVFNNPDGMVIYATPNWKISAIGLRITAEHDEKIKTVTPKQ